MSEHGRAIIELAERTWAELGDAERDVFDDWLGPRALARGEDLYMLLRFARRRWARPRRSSSQTFAAIRDMEDRER